MSEISSRSCQQTTSHYVLADINSFNHVFEDIRIGIFYVLKDMISIKGSGRIASADGSVQHAPTSNAVDLETGLDIG